MIVKNTPDYQFTSSKQYQQTKPYFLQGLQYAKQLLLNLKKQKQSQIQYSPISRKHTKLSSDVIIQQNIQQNNYQQIKYYNSKIKQQKNRKIKNQEIDSNNQSLKTTKIKYIDNDNNSIKHQYMKFQDIPQIQEIQHIYSISQQQQQQHQPQHQPQQQQQQQNQKYQRQYQHNKKQNNQNPILSSIKYHQQQINKIGQQLQIINTQLQLYQIVFDNLCDCYRANQSIYIKNQKLRKQGLRLQQQKQDIINKITQISKQFQELDNLEKQSNQFIGKSVQEYVRQLCQYNRQDKLQIFSDNHLEIQKQFIDIDNQEEVYEKSLNLNYKKLKDRYDERVKKKGLLEPKKLQKNVSFQEQIDVITKYYQSQLSNI